MTDYNSDRKLTYEARNAPLPPQTYDELIPDCIDSSRTWPADNRIVLQLTEQDWVKIVSCVHAASEVWWPDEAFRLQDILQKSFICLDESGTTMSCQDVANCIEDVTSPASAATRNTAVAAQSAATPASVPPANVVLVEYYPNNVASDQVSASPDPCNLDIVWSGIREMVRRIEEASQDALQDIIAGGDNVERLAKIVDLIPIIGDTLNDISEFITEFDEDVLNAFNSVASITTQDEIACELFSLVCQECRFPTHDEVLNYYVSRSVADMPTLLAATPLALAGALSTAIKGILTLAPAVIYNTVCAIQVYSYTFNRLFVGGFGEKTLGIWARLGSDVQNDDYLILCDPCADNWIAVLDFTQSDEGASGYSVLGSAPSVWESGRGWVTQPAAGGYAGGVQVTESFIARAITVTWVTDTGVSNNLNGSIGIQNSTVNWNAGGAQLYSYRQEYASLPTTFINAASANGGGTGVPVLTRIVIEGQGTNPFV